MRFTSVFAGLAVTMMASTAIAATTTPEQAQAVKASLERYLGHGDDTTPSPVSVTPDGDHLAIAIDVKRVLRGLETFGLTMEPATYALNAMPQDDGLWHVTSPGMPRMTVKHGADSYSVVMNGTVFDGLFDPSLPGFSRSSLGYDSMSIAVAGPKGGTETRQIKGGKQTSVATKAGDGISNLQLAQSNEGFSQDVTLDAAPMAGPGGSNKIAVTSAATSTTLAVEALRSRALMDLWAFFVAHPSAGTLKAGQTELRGALKAALPLFDRWTQGGSAEHLSVESPFGSVTLQSVGGQIRTTGLAAQGEFSSELNFEGLTLPADILPAWTDGLLPTAAQIKYGFAGFHLDEAARLAVESFDLNAKQPLSPPVLAKMRESLGPLDQMIVTLAPTHIASKLVDLHIDGDARLHLPIPDFHVNVRASGLDKAIQDIQARSAGDKTASEVIAVLIVAKGLGKAEPDGSLTWIVAKGPAGDITVNGVALPGSGP